MAAVIDEIPREHVRPLKRREYDRLVELGVFDREPIELLYGKLVRKMTQNPPHAAAVQCLNAILLVGLVGRASIRVQAPFAASDESEPEPDFAVVPLGAYRDEHPSEAYLLIEVADATLRTDRKVKAPLYAACGVPEYWIVDVVAEVIEVHRDSAGGRYRKVTRHAAGESIALLAFPDVAVAVDHVFPPRPPRRPSARKKR